MDWVRSAPYWVIVGKERVYVGIINTLEVILEHKIFDKGVWIFYG